MNPASGTAADGYPRPEGKTHHDSGAGPILPGLLDCMHCGLCLQSCPTYRITGSETDSPRGRLALLRAVGEGRLTDTEIAEPLSRCVACRACEPACPSAVPYHDLLQGHQQRTADPLLVRRLATWLGSRRRQNLAARVGRIANRTGILKAVRRFGPRTLRRLAGAMPVKPRGTAIQEGLVRRASSPQRGVVHLHLGCVDPHVFGEVLDHTVAVLVQQGFEVHVPRQPACCGALEAHAGAPDVGRGRGRETLDALQGADAVLVPAAGCHAFLKGMDPKVPVLDPMQFLLEQGLRGDLAPIPLRCAWDPPCHQQNVAKTSASTRTLLERIPELVLVDHAEAELCCGAGGIAFLREAEMTGAVGASKAQHLLAADPEIVASGNPGCRIQLEGSLRSLGGKVPVVHPLSLLAQSLGVA